MIAVGSEQAALRASRMALAGVLLVMVINMLGFGIIVPLLPFYARSFHATGWQIGLFFSGYSAGSFFGEPFWGRLSDRIGRKPVLVATVAANCVCFLALAFAPNVYAGCLIRFLGGMAGGSGSVLGSYIADVTPPAYRAGRMGILGAAYNAGFIFGPGLGGLLAHPAEGPAGFRPPLLVAAVLAAASAAGILVVMRERRTDESTVRMRAARSPWSVTRQALGHPVVGRVMILTFAAGLAFNGIESTFGFWATHRYAWTTANVGLCFTAAALAATVSQSLLTGPLSRRFGQAPVLASGLALTVLCMALQPLSPTGLVTIALFTAMSVGQSMAYPNTSAMISRATNPDRQGQVLGLNNAMDGLSRLVGPQAALALFAWDANLPFVAGAGAAGTAIVFALAAGRAAGRRATEPAL